MLRRRRLRLYEVSAADGVGALVICADAGRQDDFEVKSDGSGVDLAAGGRDIAGTTSAKTAGDSR